MGGRDWEMLMKKNLEKKRDTPSNRWRPRGKAERKIECCCCRPEKDDGWIMHAQADKSGDRQENLDLKDITEFMLYI